MPEFEIVQRAAQAYAAIRITTAMTEISAEVPPLNGEVFRWLNKHGIMPVGPEFWKYTVINMTGSLTIEAGVAIAGAAESDGRVLVGELPVGAYLQTTYHGHPNGLMGATTELLAYADQHDLRFDMTRTAAGEEWVARLELYLSDPDDQPDMNQWDTILAFKLAD